MWNLWWPTKKRGSCWYLLLTFLWTCTVCLLRGWWWDWGYWWHFNRCCPPSCRWNTSWAIGKKGRCVNRDWRSRPCLQSLRYRSWLYPFFHLMCLRRCSSRATGPWCRGWWSAPPGILLFFGSEVPDSRRNFCLFYTFPLLKRFPAIVLRVERAGILRLLWRGRIRCLIGMWWRGRRAWFGFLNYSFYNIPTDLNSIVYIYSANLEDGFVGNLSIRNILKWEGGSWNICNFRNSII